VFCSILSKGNNNATYCITSHNLYIVNNLYNLCEPSNYVDLEVKLWTGRPENVVQFPADATNFFSFVSLHTESGVH
jgi:hypothetical protein